VLNIPVGDQLTALLSSHLWVTPPDGLVPALALLAHRRAISRRSALAEALDMTAALRQCGLGSRPTPQIR
jgi:hypothetical protein